jgi:hypothetical protein
MPRRIVIVAAALTCAAVAPAFAAPARTVAVSGEAPVATWDGGPGNGAGTPGATRCVRAIYECEDTLVEVRAAGDLLAEIKAGSGSEDLDVAIYKSDSAGTAPSGDARDPGTPVAEDISDGKDAKATARKAQPGFYVVRVRFYKATAGAYKGTATLKVPPPAVSPAPAPATPAAPAPAAAPKPAAQQKPKPKKSTAACRRKAKKVKNAKKRKAALKKCAQKGK